jgi:hypothetical protein
VWLLACLRCRRSSAPVPADLVVLPVQSTMWLDGVVDLDGTTVIIKPSKTDYMFVQAKAWGVCKATFGASLKDGYKLVTANQTPQDALIFMLRHVVGLYEVKTAKNFSKSGEHKVSNRSQQAKKQGVSNRRHTPRPLFCLARQSSENIFLHPLQGARPSTA